MNMKKVRYILMMAAAVLLAAACNHDADEMTIPSTTPAFKAHSDVVVNSNTENETLTLAWTPAKFGEKTQVNYTVTATLDGQAQEIGQISDTCLLSMTNAELFKKMGISEVGDYAITFSLNAAAANGASKKAEDMTVNFKYDHNAYLWVPNSGQGDDFAAASRLLQKNDGKGKHFYGYVYLEGNSQVGLRLSSQPSTEGTIYGAGSAAGKLVAGANAAAIKFDAGLYYFDVDLKNLSYVAIPLNRVGLVGEMNGWGGSGDTPMVYNPKEKTWYATAKVEKNQSYKVRFNNMWDIPAGADKYNLSLGESPKNLVVASNTNLTVATTGVVGFTLNLNDYPYTITESLIKENSDALYAATSVSSWDYSNAPMLKKVADGEYLGCVTMASAGTVLFSTMRSSAGTIYGGTAAAIAKGSTVNPIALAAGTYMIDLNLNTLKMTAMPVKTVAMKGASFNVAMTKAAAGKYTLTNTFAADDFYRIVLTTDAMTVNGASQTEFAFGGSCLELVYGGDELLMKKDQHSLDLRLGLSYYNQMFIDGLMKDFDLYPTEIGVTGDFGDISWDMGKSPKLPGDKKTGIYKGFVSMYKATCGFKFTIQKSNTWYGGTETSANNYSIGSDKGDNLKIADGLYFWTVDLANKTAIATPMTRVALIGDATPTGWAGDTEMKYNPETGKYELTIALTIPGAMKIRFNSDWTYNLGGDPANLQQNSANNIAVSAAGTYFLQLDLTHTPYTLVMTKK
jgi:hypothetical protein